jgi:penicillin-binding protein 2
MRGKRYAPRLVTRIRDSTTGVIRRLPPTELPPVEVSDPSHWDTIIGGMVGVTNDWNGTARRLQVDLPYRIAGKSGTAQVFGIKQDAKYKESEVAERLRDHALFIAFAPAEDPQIAVAVVVENGRSGSGTAGPIARTVIDAYLRPEFIADPAAGPGASPSAGMPSNAAAGTVATQAAGAPPSAAGAVPPQPAPAAAGGVEE